jgi:hypothetical protein
LVFKFLGWRGRDGMAQALPSILTVGNQYVRDALI